jgi:hypothetical protein
MPALKDRFASQREVIALPACPFVPPPPIYSVVLPWDAPGNWLVGAVVAVVILYFTYSYLTYAFFTGAVYHRAGTLAAATRRRLIRALFTIVLIATLPAITYVFLVYLPAMDRIGTWGDSQVLSALSNGCRLDAPFIRSTTTHLIAELNTWFVGLVSLAVLGLLVLFISARWGRQPARKRGADAVDDHPESAMS